MDNDSSKQNAVKLKHLNTATQHGLETPEKQKTVISVRTRMQSVHGRINKVTEFASIFLCWLLIEIKNQPKLDEL